MHDELASLDAMHQGTHAIADRLVAMRVALVAQGFSEPFAEAACLQYNAVIMKELQDQMDLQRQAAGVTQ